MRNLTIDRLSPGEAKILLGLEYLTGDANAKVSKALRECDYELGSHFNDHGIALGKNVTVVSPYKQGEKLMQKIEFFLLDRGFTVNIIKDMDFLYSENCTDYLVMPIEMPKEKKC